MGDPYLVFALAVFVGSMLLAPFWVLAVFRPWLKAFASGAHVPMPVIVGMRLRKVPPMLIVDARVELLSNDIDVPVRQLEKLYLAHGYEIRSAHDLAKLARRETEEKSA